MEKNKIEVLVTSCTLLTILEGEYAGQYMKIESSWWQVYGSGWEACYNKEPILDVYLKDWMDN